MGITSGISSAAKGLIPKSTGGRMALGAGGVLGVAAGVAGYRRSRPKGVPVTGDFTSVASPQKQYEWMREGGSSHSSAAGYIGSKYSGYDTSSLRM